VPPPSLLSGFQIFVSEGFLAPRTCRSVAAEMRTVEGTPATVSGPGSVDYRRTTIAQVSEETRRMVDQRLRKVIPALERHFGETLSEVERPQFLVYRKGDYFRPHRDSPPEGAAYRHKPIRRVAVRRVSSVVFLNAEGAPEEEGRYGGGRLMFPGLAANVARGEAVAHALDPRPGKLIAFRSQTVHAVTPVTHGERCTIVSWFF
jgi:predicted 2-oxoglutarate/Fe(II)-dependent dioxygenase YbiX